VIWLRVEMPGVQGSLDFPPAQLTFRLLGLDGAAAHCQAAEQCRQAGSLVHGSRIGREVVQNTMNSLAMPGAEINALDGKAPLSDLYSKALYPAPVPWNTCYRLSACTRWSR
jgi:hypothetical protein